MHMDFVYTKLSRFIRLTTFLVTITAIPIVDTVLTSFPTDTEAVVGQTVRLSCSTSDRYYVLWEHTPVGAANYEYVYFSGRIITPYHMRHRIEGNSSTGEYNLVINNVQLSDAGVYGCVDQAGHGERIEAQLIVLDSHPTCNSSDEVIGENPCNIPEEQIKIRCMIGYSGNRSPALKCGVKDDTTTDVSATLTENSNNKETYYSALNISNMRNKNSTLVCRTSLFNIASNDLYIKMLYISKESSIHRLDHPEQLSCFIKSSQPCRYKWSRELHGTKTDFSADVIWANKTGIYRCEADCILRNKQCTSVPLIVYFSEAETTTQLQPEGKETSILVYILVPLSVFLFVMGLIGIVILLKRRWRTSEGTETPDCDKKNGDSTNASQLLPKTEGNEKSTFTVDDANSKNNIENSKGLHRKRGVEHSSKRLPIPSTISVGSNDSNTPLIQQTSESKLLKRPITSDSNVA